MKKADFRKVAVENIDGGVELVNISGTLGNMMYMQGQNIEECELGRAIYQAGKISTDKESTVELDDGQVKMIERFLTNFNYIVRVGIEKQLK